MTDPTTYVQVPPVEVWDGTTWSIEPTPLVTGGGKGVLLAVSCTSARFCMAVGLAGGTSGVVAEMWDGVSWTTLAAPVPSQSAQAGLNSVSCTSAAACTAVGSTSDMLGAEMPLVERWDGAGWTLQATPSPAGAPRSTLAAVACTSSTTCIAVGLIDVKAAAFALVWRGTTWTLQSPPPSRPHGSLATLKGISCTPTSCAAAGDSTTITGAKTPLVDRYA
jgi:hypothetical protein